MKKVLGWIMLCAPFAALTICTSVSLKYWWAGPAVMACAFGAVCWIKIAADLTRGNKI
jgi:hypothetical protein